MSSTSLHILLTTPNRGGIWTYTLQLAEAMRPYDVQFQFAVLGGPLNPTQIRQAAALSNVEVAEGGYKLEWDADSWRDVDAAGDWLIGLERDYRPDVVHLNNFCHAALPWHAPTLVVGHGDAISWAEACAPRSEGTGTDSAFFATYRRRVREALRSADLVAAPTRAALATIDRHFGPLERTRVLPNGRSPQTFKPADKGPTIVAAGTFEDEAKNLRMLVDIAPELPWPVVIAGPSDKAKHANAKLLGPLSPAKFARQLATAAVFASPSRYEAFGLTALEAAHSGCALVLADIPAYREVWADAAVYVAPEDAAGWRRTLDRVALDDALRLRLSSKARHRAMRFTPGEQARLYRSVYRNLIGEPFHPSAGNLRQPNLPLNGLFPPMPRLALG